METGSVIWQEGLFLRPQLFQQQERFFLNWFEQRCSLLRPYNWGLIEIKIDTESLRLGKLALLACKGVFPDGTPFDAPNKIPLPPPLNIPSQMKDCEIYLGLPLQQKDISPVVSRSEVNPLARFVVEDKKVQDLCTPGLSEVADVQLGILRLGLLTQYDNTQAFTLIPLAKVIEKTTDNLVSLSANFIPTILYTQASQVLQGFVRMICGLLKQRGDKLAQSLVNPSGAGAAEVSKFLQLQMINRYELLFAHLERMSELHPEELYRLLLMLVGEFATFTRDEKRTVALGAYYHHDLELTFKHLIFEIERIFNTTEIDKAVRLEIKEQKFGIWVGNIPDKSLIGNAAFILAAKAQVAPEEVRQAFPKQTTVSTVNKIASLVNSQLPGIALDPMPVAPPQIPFHVGFSYFSINTQDPTWPLLATGVGLAVHIGTNLPGLELELWAIRN